MLIALERRPWTLLFGSMFLLTAFLNGPYLFDPPYWDALMAVWQQGIWLRNHGWDFAALREQPGFFQGGSHLNVLYLQAVLVGALGEVMQPRTLALVLHLVSCACAAGCFVCALCVMRGLVPRATAWMFALAGWLDPIFSGQSASVYVDIQVAFGVMLTLWLLHRRRHLAAAMVVLLSFVLKPAVVLFGVAILVWLLSAAVLQRVYGHGAGVGARWPLIGAALGLLVLFALTQPASPATDMRPLVGLSLVGWKLWYARPMSALVAVAALALAGVALARASTRVELARRDWHGVVLLCAIFVGGFWLSFALVPLSLARYTTMIVFPTMIVAALMAHSALPRAGVGLGVVVALASVLGQQGIGYPELPGVYTRSGEFLERNRLWLHDQEANMALAELIEEKYADRTILAKYPFVQMLCSPELGFVKRAPRRLFAVGAVPSTCDIPLLDPQRQRLPNGTLFIWAANNLQHAFAPPLNPGPRTTALWVDKSLGGDLVLYELEVEATP